MEIIFTLYNNPHRQTHSLDFNKLFGIVMTKHINKPNYLASRLERIATAKLSLPKKLMANYQRLQQHTQLVHQALQDWLPAHILAQCQVVESNPFSLTLAVNSYTTAAHLRHLSEMIRTRLMAYDATFAQLRTLKIHAYDINKTNTQKP